MSSVAGRFVLNAPLMEQFVVSLLNPVSGSGCGSGPDTRPAPQMLLPAGRLLQHHEQTFFPLHILPAVPCRMLSASVRSGSGIHELTALLVPQRLCRRNQKGYTTVRRRSARKSRRGARRNERIGVQRLLARQPFVTGILRRTSARSPTLQPERSLHGHSSRRAEFTSRPAARAAGTQDATTATSKKSTVMATNVDGSVALTPTNMLSIVRVRARAASTPMASPTAVRRSPWPTTSLKMLAGAAPRAMRTPISDVRRRTTVARTP